MNFSLSEKIKRIDYRYYIIVFITLVLFSLSYVYRNSFIRLFESSRDLVFSVGYYFAEIFGIKDHGIKVSVLESSRVNLLNQNFESFKASFSSYFKAFGSPSVFKNYIKIVFTLFFVVFTFGFSILLIVVGMFYLVKSVVFKVNNNYGKKSKFLVFYDKLVMKLLPIKNFVKDFIVFLSDNVRVVKFWFFLGLLYLNVFSLLFTLVSWCFYVFVSFDFLSFYKYLFKLVQDLNLMFAGLPKIFWVLIGLYVFHFIRKKIAITRLNIYERRNRGFINKLPIVNMAVGSMGKNKTTLITDMVISQVSIFRYQAQETMYKIEMRYPKFNFLSFERWIQKCIETGSIYNLASIEKVITQRFDYFYFCMFFPFKRTYYSKQEKNNVFKLLWGYNYINDILVFDDKLQLTYLKDDLTTYAKAFFIYITNTFLVSNYSIRTDDLPVSNGNAIVWNDDFFTRKSKDQKRYSRYSKILDFDLLRLGKTVVENNKISGAFEFGVVAITEIGKERLNKPEMEGLKKADTEANQKNDLFNYWLKMCRHPSTVDYNPYLKVFCDEQRPESLGADVRELAEIIYIDDAVPSQLSLPMFVLEDWLCESLGKRLKNFYYKYRFCRADETALFRFIKFLSSKLFCYRLRIYNQYGFFVLNLSRNKGVDTIDKVFDPYYIMHKKIYSKRFATDAFKNYFYDRASGSDYSLNTAKNYDSVVASLEELQQQNSYFINSILNISKEYKCNGKKIPPNKRW